MISAKSSLARDLVLCLHLINSVVPSQVLPTADAGFSWHYVSHLASASGLAHFKVVGSGFVRPPPEYWGTSLVIVSVRLAVAIPANFATKLREMDRRRSPTRRTSFGDNSPAYSKEKGMPVEF